MSDKKKQYPDHDIDSCWELASNLVFGTNSPMHPKLKREKLRDIIYRALMHDKNFFETTVDQNKGYIYHKEESLTSTNET